jgi:hypothetical protein
MRFELETQGVQVRFDIPLLDPRQLDLAAQEAVIIFEGLQDADDGAIGPPAPKVEVDGKLGASERAPPDGRDWIKEQSGEISVCNAEGYAERQMRGRDANHTVIGRRQPAIHEQYGRGERRPGPSLGKFADGFGPSEAVEHVRNGGEDAYGSPHQENQNRGHQIHSPDAVAGRSFRTIEQPHRVRRAGFGRELVGGAVHEHHYRSI